MPVVLVASASVLVPRKHWRITVPATVFSMGALILTLLCLLTPGVSGSSRRSWSQGRCWEVRARLSGDIADSACGKHPDGTADPAMGRVRHRMSGVFVSVLAFAGC